MKIVFETLKATDAVIAFLEGVIGREADYVELDTAASIEISVSGSDGDFEDQPFPFGPSVEAIWGGDWRFEADRKKCARSILATVEAGDELSAKAGKSEAKIEFRYDGRIRVTLDGRRKSIQDVWEVLAQMGENAPENDETRIREWESQCPAVPPTETVRSVAKKMLDRADFSDAEIEDKSDFIELEFDFGVFTTPESVADELLWEPFGSSGSGGEVAEFDAPSEEGPDVQKVERPDEYK